jgi:crossover junction endodeoxyribonuclease RuvC
MTRPEEIVLGVDPGSRQTGLAVMKGREILFVDVLHTGSIHDHSDRISEIYTTVQSVIRRWGATSCAVETPVYGKDPLALLKLGRAQAAVMLAAINLELPVTEYYPKAVKKSITGNGNASKEQVARMIEAVLKVDVTDLPKDATDALAVAWCHSVRRPEIMHSDVAARPASRRGAKDPWAEFARQNPKRIRS